MSDEERFRELFINLWASEAQARKANGQIPHGPEEIADIAVKAYKQYTVAKSN